MGTRGFLIEKYEEEKQTRNHTISLKYSENLYVDRVWNGETKNFYPKYYLNGKWEKSGVLTQTEVEVVPYISENFHEASCKWLLVHEGEKSADYATNAGIVSTCLIGSATTGLSKHPKVTDSLFNAMKIYSIVGLIYLADNDNPGQKKAKEFQEICQANNIDCLCLDIKTIYPIAEKGDDIVELLKNRKFPVSTLAENIEAELNRNYEKYLNYQITLGKKIETESCSTVQAPPRKASKPSFTLLAIEEIFGDEKWILVAGKPHQLKGDIYEERPEGEIKKRIHYWCTNHVDEKGEKSKATSYYINMIYDFFILGTYVNPELINSAGIPLKNGFLIHRGNGEFALKKYNPEFDYFTYRSEVEYDPQADMTQANAVLECLDEPYKTLFVQTLSTILDFWAIRQRWDRIKALMLIGDGSNGKDTLREIMSLILGGKGITNCSISDFSDHNRFALLPLATNPKINWSSESGAVNIDGSKKLKAAITGDPLTIEPKGKDSFPIDLSTLFLFNTNETPDVQGNQQAISSRLTLVPFTKTYSTNPKRGELKANPRYKHDREFLTVEICPAFLNLLIAKFKEVLINGINYQNSEAYYEEIITENNHIRQFVNWAGLIFTNDENDQVAISTIWCCLLEWYYEQGIVSFETTPNNKIKNIWNDVGTKKDPYVKASKNLKPRLLEVFPKAKIKIIHQVVHLTGLYIEEGESKGSQKGVKRESEGSQEGSLKSFNSNKTI
jgi:putative DNA primase/helicase